MRARYRLLRLERTCSVAIASFIMGTGGHYITMTMLIGQYPHHMIILPSTFYVEKLWNQSIMLTWTLLLVMGS